MKKLDIKVGTKVWVEPSSNHRTEEEREPYETTVTKVGHKYFEIESIFRTKFNLSNGKQGNWSNYASTVYVDKQVLIDKIEQENLAKEIKSLFNGFGKLTYSLDTLRKIKTIIDND